MPSLVDLPTSVVFTNLTTNHVNAYKSSFLQMESGSRIQIHNSRIFQVFSFGTGAVLEAIESNSEMVFYDTQFEENSAISAALFQIDSSSLIKMYRCTVNHNFAIVSTILEADNNGRFEFYDSSFIENYATRAYFGELSVVSSPAVINN